MNSKILQVSTAAAVGGIGLMASIGQPVAGVVGSSMGDIVLCSGFVCGGNTLPSNMEYWVYSPTIIKDEN